MKKLLLTNILLLCAGGFLVAQTQKIVSPSEYDQLKQQNKLEKGTSYISTESKSSIASTQKIYPSVNHTDSVGNSCSCMIALDSTFSVVPMSLSTDSINFRNDDGSSSAIHLPFVFSIFGNSYDSLYINNNGNISFDAAYTIFTANNFPDPTYKMVAPFWADVDTRNLLSGLVYYKITPHYMIVKWDHVGYYSSYADKLNDFQLIISDGTDSSIAGNNNVAFCYGDMQWTTGDASSGVNGFGGVPSTVGVNNGDGVNFSQITRNDSIGIQCDGPNGLNDGIDWLDNRSFYFNTAGLIGVEPIAYDSLCDSLVPVFDSLGNPFRVFLNSMNANDSISYSVQSLPIGMFINPVNSGNATMLSISYFPVAMGQQTLNINYSNSRYPGVIHNYSRIFDVLSFSSAVSIKNMESSKNISFYPNPAKNTLSFNFDTNETYSVKIIDVLGKTIGIHYGVSNQSNTIEFSNINKGMYTIIIESAAKNQVIKKLIIE